jgi:protein TonB
MIRARRARLLGFAPTSGGAASAVFAGGRDRARRRLAVAAMVACLCYGALGIWLARSPRRAPEARPPPEMVVELFEPAPPPPPPAPPPPEATRARHAPLPPNPSPAAPSERPAAPAPAQAAEVVARETPADEPLDLTGFAVVTGKGARYAGGSTTSSGTSARAANGPVAPGGATGLGAPDPDLSRPVGVPEAEWEDCGWPQEADALGIDQQTVSMRAIARADGSFESGEVVHDPGHGFGAALLACAKRHGFVPALDRRGKPIRARSAIIRFTFTR